MLDLDHLQEMAATLRRNKLRAVLTAFGVFWGIFMLVLMLGTGNGLETGMMRDFSGTATNSFFVWTQRTSKPYRGLPRGRSIQLTNEDVAAIRQEIPDARRGAAQPARRLRQRQHGDPRHEVGGLQRAGRRPAD